MLATSLPKRRSTLPLVCRRPENSVRWWLPHLVSDTDVAAVRSALRMSLPPLTETFCVRGYSISPVPKLQLLVTGSWSLLSVVQLPVLRLLPSNSSDQSSFHPEPGSYSSSPWV